MPRIINCVCVDGSRKVDNPVAIKSQKIQSIIIIIGHNIAINTNKFIITLIETITVSV